jgi:hypothetical protein
MIECGPGKRREPVKLLGQDGRLMEVDPSEIRMVKKKASNEEMQTWINKKPINDIHSTTES